MAESIIISIFVFTLQFCGAYLRYLAIAPHITKQERRNLFRSFACLIVISFGISMRISLTHPELIAHSYKYSLLLGAFLWMGVFFIVIRHRNVEQVFILGMVSCWTFLLHTVSSMICSVCIPGFEGEVLPSFTLAVFEASVYLLLYLLLLPVERHFFRTLLSVGLLPFFRETSFGWGIAILPLLILLLPLALILDMTFVHPWQERICRMFLPLIFFFLYRSILHAAARHQRDVQLARHKRLLQHETEFLRNYTRLMQEGQEGLRILRHDMRHQYRLVYTLMANGETEQAMQHIERQEAALDATVIRPYSTLPLINAVLSIYTHQSEAAGIRFSQKVNLPAALATDEGELASLLSNLLENALHAASTEEEERAITLFAQHKGTQCVLEITNTYTRPLRFAPDGLPASSPEKGHGIGLLSLRAFIEKYHVTALCEQVDGIVRFLLYWQDKRLAAKVCRT